MAVSVPEVMYGAYYPYLYGRGAARSFHHAHAHAHAHPTPFQYDRFNVQSGSSGESYAAAALSSGSASSGCGSPPHAHSHLAHQRHRTKEEDAHGRASADGVGGGSGGGGGSSESEGECASGVARVGSCGGVASARAQYVSANCVVFTHYSGEAAAVVDEHFARALAIDKHKESAPMASRNLPASFFNAAALPCPGGSAGGPGGGGVELYEYDPWHHGAHYGGYHGHAHAHAQYHHNMAAAAGYGGLLLGRGALHHHQYKPVDWTTAQHHLDPAHPPPYSYPPVPGLEAQVQDTSKDLYWF